MDEKYFYQVSPGVVHRDQENRASVILKGGGIVAVYPAHGEHEEGAKIRASVVITDRYGGVALADLTPAEAQAIIKSLQKALRVAYRRGQDFREEKS